MNRSFILAIYSISTTFLSMPQVKAMDFEYTSLLQTLIHFEEYPDYQVPGSKKWIKETHTTAGVAYRQAIRAYFGESYALNSNFLFSMLERPRNNLLQTPEPSFEFRSRKLQHTWYHRSNVQGQWQADQLYLRASMEQIDIKVGRQPINLATTYYFTPNDFFAPFNALNFFREYKPGVDSMRLDYSLGELSELSLISVLGYKKNQKSADENELSSDHHSYMIRFSTNIAGYDLGAISGKFTNNSILGFFLQSDLPFEIGLRLEANHKNPKTGDDGDKSSSEAVLGLEKRLTDQLIVQWEQFFNGRGYDKTDDYAKVMTAKNPPQYLGKNYCALAGLYDLSALWTSRMVVIANIDDQSFLLNLHAQYSLSDEADFIVSYLKPKGEFDDYLAIESEFGLYPSSFTMETRMYF